MRISDWSSDVCSSDLDRSRERGGWPVVEVADRRDEEPGHGGLFSPALVSLLRSDARVLCVLNRTGRARLLYCASSAALAHSTACSAGVATPAHALPCRRRGATPPPHHTNHRTAIQQGKG